MYDKPLFPLALDLRGRVCLILAGESNAEAAKKREALLECGAVVRHLQPEAFEPAAMEGAFFVLSLVKDPAFSSVLDRHARESRTLLWCIDQPGFGSVSMMAVAKGGPARVAASTSGAAPAVSSAFRKGLERAMDRKFQRFVETLGALRRTLREHFPGTQGAATRIQEMMAASSGFAVHVTFDYPAWFEGREVNIGPSDDSRDTPCSGTASTTETSHACSLPTGGTTGR